jgi:hypothetical protein
MRVVKPLLDRYGTRDGRPYRIAIAAYPEPKEDQA